MLAGWLFRTLSRSVQLAPPRCPKGAGTKLFALSEMRWLAYVGPMGLLTAKVAPQWGARALFLARYATGGWEPGPGHRRYKAKDPRCRSDGGQRAIGGSRHRVDVEALCHCHLRNLRCSGSTENRPAPRTACSCGPRAGRPISRGRRRWKTVNAADLRIVTSKRYGPVSYLGGRNRACRRQSEVDQATARRAAARRQSIGDQVLAGTAGISTGALAIRVDRSRGIPSPLVFSPYPG